MKFIFKKINDTINANLAIALFASLFLLLAHTGHSQIGLPQGNTLNLTTSSDYVYLETRILFTTGKYKSEDYCWNKISDSLDTRWTVSSCFNGDCKNDLLQMGCFIKDYGLNDSTCFIAFHVGSNLYEGKSVIKYSVYNKNVLTDNAELIFNITYSKTAGIKLNSSQDLLSVFPNPTADKLGIKTAQPLSQVYLSITNQMGHIVSETQFETFHQEAIDINVYPSGIYQINLIDINGKEYRYRFVKL